MFARQIRQAGLALAALALSATVAMPLAQPADAAGEPRPTPADLAVKYIDRKVFSTVNLVNNLFDENARIEYYFAVTNEGQSKSGTIFVEKWCYYEATNNNAEMWANVTAMPITQAMEPSLPAGGSQLITVNCPTRGGTNAFLPDGVRLKVRGTEEPSTRQGNNMAEKVRHGV